MNTQSKPKAMTSLDELYNIVEVTNQLFDSVYPDCGHNVTHGLTIVHSGLRAVELLSIDETQSRIAQSLLFRNLLFAYPFEITASVELIDFLELLPGYMFIGRTEKLIETEIREDMRTILPHVDKWGLKNTNYIRHYLAAIVLLFTLPSNTGTNAVVDTIIPKLAKWVNYYR